LALPIVLVLFMGCVQLVQIGVAHVVVMEAAYEAGRQFALDQDPVHAAQVARDICRPISPGLTEFEPQIRGGRVSHHLRPVVAVIQNVKITHTCPAKLFQSGQGQDE